MVTIYTLTSTLHDAEAVAAATRDFLGSLQLDYVLKDNFDDYGSTQLSLIYVRTGGTENIFKGLLPQLLHHSPHPIYLLASGKSNSLAASMEILSYLRQQGVEGEILHGSVTYIHERIKILLQVASARQHLSGQRLGIIGHPSDWLISSDADPTPIQDKLGVELIDISIRELLEVFGRTDLDNNSLQLSATPPTCVAQALPDATRLYYALQQIVERYSLSGFTIRCFDLLTAIHNTGCLALAQLNADGIVAGCEGDVPAALSMMIAQALLGLTGFQCNPSSIDPESGTITLAHCTIPLNLVSHYELDTHFESGIGVGIRGYMPEGPVTVFKFSGDLSRHFVAEGYLTGNTCSAELCRTQLSIRLDNTDKARYFLTNPIGNHHIVIPGHHASLLELLANQMHP